ncbi:MAG: MATE family efflux transporter [Pseudomonadota bacterium]
MPPTDPKAVTYRRVAAIALPVVLSNATVPLQGAVDTAIIGNLGSAVFLAAVTLGAAAIQLILQVFNFLQFGAAALGAQAEGAGDHRRVINVLARSLIVAGGVGVTLIVLQWPITWALMSVFEGSDRAEELAAVYIAIRIWTAPAELANFALMGWFAGQEQTRRLFEMQLVVSLSNIVLNLIFVLGLGMDVDGVALGTLIAAYLGLAYGLWHARARMQALFPGWRMERARLLNAEEIGKMFRLSRDIFIRTILLAGALTWMTRLGSQQGDIVLAANGILYQIFHVTTYGLDGFAIASEALVGKAIGAQNRELLRQSVRVSCVAAAVLALSMAALILVLETPLIALFTNVYEVRAAAHSFYIWTALLPLVGVLAFQMDGIFVGATEGAAMRNGMIVSAGLYYMFSGWAAEGYGNHGVWAGIWGFLLLRGLTLAVQYPRLEARAIGP